MSRIWTATTFAVGMVLCTASFADGIVAALVPPAPSQKLAAPVMPNETQITPLATPVALPAIEPTQDGTAEIVGRQANISNFGTICGPSLSVTATQGAMLDVAVSAPCLPSSMIEVAHGGLTFTVLLTMTGDTIFALPALNEAAQISVRLSDGSTLSATTQVPEVAAFARVALQWDGADPGELVSNAPKVLDGDMYRLGAEPHVLHVFSRRLGDLTRSGVVRLSMRSDVTHANCGADQSARVLRAVPGEAGTILDVTLRARDCGRVGQSLELKNVLQDLKVGGN